MPQLTPEEEFERNRKILPGDPGRSDRKPGYRVQRRDDGRTGVIVAVGSDGAGSTHYTVRWDDGETELIIPSNQLDDAF
jgi:hypothetical protein